MKNKAVYETKPGNRQPDKIYNTVRDCRKYRSLVKPAQTCLDLAAEYILSRMSLATTYIKSMQDEKASISRSDRSEVGLEQDYALIQIRRGITLWWVAEASGIERKAVKVGESLKVWIITALINTEFCL